MKELAQSMLEYDEGRRKKAYRCTAGYLTIGVGHNLDANGLPDHIIDLLLEHSMEVATRDLDTVLPNWTSADPIRRAALLNWSFQLGASRMRQFKNTLPYLSRQRWTKAADNLRLSKWATRDSPERAARVIHMIEFGTMPAGYPHTTQLAAVAAVDAEGARA